MQAIVLTRNGGPHDSFEVRESPDPQPGPLEIRVAVRAFGLNFADVMARIGAYQDAPPLPSVLGYEVVGHVDAVGEGVTETEVGRRVVAFTRFGGYSTHVVTPESAAASLPDSISDAEALGLPTQMGTAWFCAEDRVRIRQGDRVLVHAAAGGVGTGIVQLAKRRGAVVFGSAGSDEKLEFLRSLGVDHPINYRTHDFAVVVREVCGDAGLDVVFDSIGGETTRKGYHLLGSGGRLVCYGAASHAGPRKSWIRSLRMVAAFPLTHPIPLMMSSRSVIGVNMLRIADDRPAVLSDVLREVIALASEGALKVTVGGTFDAARIGDAHELLHSGKSMGKVVCVW